jgi:regulatory protein YycI of two-component signal transduction system YycFG
MKCGDGRIFDAEKNVILELPECEKITDETLKTYLSEQHINTRNDAIDTLNELRSKLDPDHENDEFNYLFEKIIAAIMNIGQHSPIQSSDQTILEKIKTYAATPINLGLMTNERMLELIRLDQPWQVINEVKSFTLNKYGYYEVEVDMEGHFFKTKIQHVRTTLPYPYLTHQKIKESLRPIVQPAPQPRK